MLFLFLVCHRTLLEDRQSLIAKNSDLLRDMLILRKEIERLKGITMNGYIRIFTTFFDHSCNHMRLIKF